MQYQEAVAEFRNLNESIEAGQWRQAQIAHDQTRPRGEHGVDEFADSVGKSSTHIDRLIRVWKQWGTQPAGLRPPFADAYRMAERFVDDPEEAAAAKDRNRAASALDKLTPAGRAGVIRRHLADPEVARETFNAAEPDDETAAKARMYAGSAISRHDQRIQAHVQERRHQEAVDRGRTDDEAQYEIASMMQVLADVVVTGGRLARKMSEGATLPDGMRRTLAGYATKAKATIEWLEGIEDEQHAEDIEEVLRVWAAES